MQIRAAVVGVVVVAAAGLAAASSYAAKDDLTLVSRASSGAKADAQSDHPVISADGRYVAFVSGASNLDSAATGAKNQVFVRDLQTNTTTLVSRASTSTGAAGNSNSFEVAISADGRYVVYSSDASNLDPADTDVQTDVFVRDLQTDTTTLVSRADTSTGAKSDGASGFAAISDDGRYIAFGSDGSNLDPADTDSTQDIFVRDLQSNTTTLVSRATGSSGAKSNDFAGSPAVSDDGRYVAFSSGATNLDPAATDGTFEAFVRDRQTNTTTLVSRATGSSGTTGNGASGASAISGDGRYVTLDSDAANLDPADTDSTGDVFVRDRQDNTTRLVSRATGSSGVKGDDISFASRISRDGRYVAFVSEATNLDSADTDSTRDVFVRDLQTNTTTLVSRAATSTGAKGNQGSMYPAISGDGRYVAFASDATNIDPADTDTTTDVFVRDVLGPPAAGGAGGTTPASCPQGTSPSVVCVRDVQGRLAMMGTAADETFVGTDGRDRISPMGGDDVVDGNGGDDLISGGTGNDTLHGGPGNDRLNGNAGNDSISGNAGNDSISGAGGDDRLTGQDGNDGLWGGPGNDSISGGTGNDRLRGQAGNDGLAGNTGRDLLSGGSGDDRLRGGPDHDRLRCGPGHDTFLDAAQDNLGSSCQPQRHSQRVQ